MDQPSAPAQAGPFKAKVSNWDALDAVYAAIVDQLEFQEPDGDVLSALARLLHELHQVTTP